MTDEEIAEQAACDAWCNSYMPGWTKADAIAHYMIDRHHDGLADHFYAAALAGVRAARHHHGGRECPAPDYNAVHDACGTTDEGEAP